jgi:hypothetical protein
MIYLGAASLVKADLTVTVWSSPGTTDWAVGGSNRETRGRAVEHCTYLFDYAEGLDPDQRLAIVSGPARSGRTRVASMNLVRPTRSCRTAFSSALSRSSHRAHSSTVSARGRACVMTPLFSPANGGVWRWRVRDA